MMCKMAGMVVFLVLCCILAQAQESHNKPILKEPIGPLIWKPVHKLEADRTYLSLGWGSDQPIDITSEKADFRNISNGMKVIFEGNVKAKQGDLILTCNRMIIVYGADKKDEAANGRAKELASAFGWPFQMKSVKASGNVKIIRNEWMAVADEVLYDYLERTIILRGGPAQLRDGKEELNGGQIIINRDENRKGPIIESIPDMK